MKLPAWTLPLVAGTVLGVGLGRFAWPEPTESSESAAEVAASQAQAEALTAAPEPPPAPVTDRQKWLREVIASLQALDGFDAATVQAALDPVITADNSAAIPILIGYWAWEDPAGALAYVQAKCTGAQRDGLLRTVFGTWANRDADRAIAAARDLSGRDRDIGLQTVLSSLRSKNPAAAVALSQSLQGQGEALTGATIRRTTLVEGGRQQSSAEIKADRALREWVQRAPAEARAHVLAMPAGPERQNAINTLVSELAAIRPAEARELVMSLPEGAARVSALKQLTHGWANQDPKGALAFVATLPEGQDKSLLVSIATSIAAQQDPRATIAWVQENLSERERDMVIGNIIRTWGAQDIQQAAAAVQTLPFGRGYGNAVMTLASQWANQDPQAAWTWASALPTGHERDYALQVISTKLVNTNPDALVPFALQDSDLIRQQTLINAIADAKARATPQEALAWAQGLPAGLSEVAQKQALHTWAEQAPAAAGAYLANSGLAQQNPNLAAEVARPWAEQDGAAAADWAASLTEPAAQLAAVDMATQVWLLHDSYAASVWVSALPAGPAREKATRNIIRTTQNSDPASAYDWALQLSDPQQRLFNVRYVYQAWLRRDPEAAERTLANSAFTPEEQERIKR